MIIDKLENISLYSCIPEHVVAFINNLSEDAALGRIELSNVDYVNVETYSPKNIKEAKFEAHKNYIDIQILLRGQERIYYTSVLGLNESIPYDESRDIVFYSEDVKSYDYLTLDGSNFAMIFPHEAHAPQVCANSNSSEVKKVVVKVKA